MTNYVCGFYFDHNLARVVLIWKEKPKWQKGKLNGVGGKIESDELPVAAMRREFHEETGILHDNWTDLIVLTGIDWCVYFFYAIGRVNEFEYAETQETEEIAKIDIDTLDSYPHISNLSWLIPLALYKLKFPEETISFFTPELVNPTSGEAGINHMVDPNAKADEATQQQAENLQESAAQDKAMEVQDSEEGTTEG